VHGGYARTVADGAAGGRPVLIVLQVRRFRCGNPVCPAVTFAEQAAGLSERYRRRSGPLLGMSAGFGLELAGRAAARLAGTLGIAVHPATVLRLIAAAPEPEVSAAPEVLGVDDFALAKGQVYWTVLVDMRTGDVIDLLPDREAATLEAWLTAHPGAGIICRDRAGNYAEGARAGAPEAIQVADRWHLWHNLAEYAEKTVACHRGCLKDHPAGGNDAPDTADTLEHELPGPAEDGQITPDGFLDACGRERRLVARTRERYAEIWGRLDAGESLSAISRVTGLDRKTVQRFARPAAPRNCWSSPPAGTRSWMSSSRTCTSGGTKASPTPPRSTPNCGNGAGPAASRPSAATSGHSGRPSPPRTRLRQSRRPARSPAGC